MTTTLKPLPKKRIIIRKSHSPSTISSSLTALTIEEIKLVLLVKTLKTLSINLESYLNNYILKHYFVFYTLQQICDAWEKNLSAWPFTHSNHDYAIMIIENGLEIGKTLECELKNLLQCKYSESLRLEAKLKDDACVACVHMFLHPKAMTFSDYP
jgi:hypothetical protein